MDASEITKEAIAEYIDGYIEKLKKNYNANDEEFMQAVFAVFVEKVVVFNDKVVVHVKGDFDNVLAGDNLSFGGLITTLAPIKKKVSFQRKKNIWAANE